MHRQGLKRNIAMTHSPNRGGPSARPERGPSAPVSVDLASDGRSGRRVGREAARAFSLLELTLVLAIIAALMGVAAFALLGQGTRAKIRATQVSLRTIQTAVGQYQLNHSTYPDTLARLVQVQPPYLEGRSMQDAWNRPIYYRTPGLGGREYTLMSGGPDGDIGTPADNIDVWTMDATGGQ
jgi:general secretion pathway protein G